MGREGEGGGGGEVPALESRSWRRCPPFLGSAPPCSSGGPLPFRRGQKGSTPPFPASYPAASGAGATEGESGARSDALPLLLSSFVPPLRGLRNVWPSTLSRCSSSVEQLCTCRGRLGTPLARQARAGMGHPQPENTTRGEPLKDTLLHYTITAAQRKGHACTRTLGPIPQRTTKMYPKVGKSGKMVKRKPSSLRETVRPTSMMCNRKRKPVPYSIPESGGGKPGPVRHVSVKTPKRLSCW